LLHENISLSPHLRLTLTPPYLTLTSLPHLHFTITLALNAPSSHPDLHLTSPSSHLRYEDRQSVSAGCLYWETFTVQGQFWVTERYSKWYK